MSKFYQYDLPEYRPSGAIRAQKQGKPARKKGKRRWIKWLVALALISILIFFYFQRNVTRVLISISEATMRASTTIAVNDAVYYTLSDDMRYDDLVTVTRNDLGDIVGLSANSLKINKIARDTASISQSNLKNLSLNGIPVPLGALTGIEAFAGLGPSIHFRIIPVSSVSCGFSSSGISLSITAIRKIPPKNANTVAQAPQVSPSSPTSDVFAF
jgi:sporulation protein YunB